MKLINILIILCLTCSPLFALNNTQKSELRTLLSQIPESVRDGGTPAIVAYLNQSVVTVSATYKKEFRVVTMPISTVTNEQGQILIQQGSKTNTITKIAQPAISSRRCSFAVTGLDIEDVQREKNP